MNFGQRNFSRSSINMILAEFCICVCRSVRAVSENNWRCRFNYCKNYHIFAIHSPVGFAVKAMRNFNFDRSQVFTTNFYLFIRIVSHISVSCCSLHIPCLIPCRLHHLKLMFSKSGARMPHNAIKVLRISIFRWLFGIFSSAKFQLILHWCNDAGWKVLAIESEGLFKTTTASKVDEICLESVFPMELFDCIFCAPDYMTKIKHFIERALAPIQRTFLGMTQIWLRSKDVCESTNWMIVK